MHDADSDVSIGLDAGAAAVYTAFSGISALRSLLPSVHHCVNV